MHSLSPLPHHLSLPLRSATLVNYQQVSTAAQTSAPPGNDFARTVKDAADIVKIIGDYLRLEKAGAQNYRGLCPFHKEKTPSFSVHATQRFYHCFGCHESGDVFTFVQKLENVTFPEALRIVATKAGVPLPKRTFSGPEEAREARQRTQLLEMHATAADWFRQQLSTAEGSRAREYLSSRDLAAEPQATFAIGYAPDSFTALRDLLQPKYNIELLRLSGLFGSKSKEDGGSGDLYDRFRKRITFPIRNEQGRVVAFTARALDTGEKAGPKYINSPETPLYTKGNVLFNLDLAKSAMRQYEFALLVEGQMDCIRVYSSGIKNVLATSGTAFTEMQVRLLHRFAQQVVVNFDPDTAGAAAAEKSIALLVEEGFAVKVLTLEEGLDPDRFIRERGAPAYIAALRGAPRYTDHLLERARKLFPPRTAENKVKAVNFLLPHMRRIQNRIARDEFASDAAQKLGIDAALLRQELKEASGKRNATVSIGRQPALSESERVLLRAILLPAGDPVRDLARRAVNEHPPWFADLSTASLLTQLAAPDDPPQLHTLDISESQRAMLARLMLDHRGDGDDELGMDQVEDAICAMQLRVLERRQKDLRIEMAQAERSGDQDVLRALCDEKLDIDRRIQEL
jgi:DNA primase